MGLTSRDDDLPPTLGVREPRRPILPTLSGTTAAPLDFAPEPEAEAIAQDARLTCSGYVCDAA